MREFGAEERMGSNRMAAAEQRSSMQSGRATQRWGWRLDDNLTAVRRLPSVELRADEHALYEGRPSWRALLSFYVTGVLAALAVGVIVALVTSAAAGLAVGAAIVVLTLLIGYLRRLFTRYLITNRRLRISRGIIRRNVQETRLERVQNVNYEQGVIDRLLRVGTVDFDTAGTDDSEFRFEWVNDPEQVVRAVDDATSSIPAVSETPPRPAPG
jgi:membrane protein YdbS with pleckstrin-like domain